MSGNLRQRPSILGISCAELGEVSAVETFRNETRRFQSGTRLFHLGPRKSARHWKVPKSLLVCTFEPYLERRPERTCRANHDLGHHYRQPYCHECAKNTAVRAIHQRATGSWHLYEASSLLPAAGTSQHESHCWRDAECVDRNVC